MKLPQLLLPRLTLLSAERANGRWHWSIGLHWPCGCSSCGTSTSPLKALRFAAREHTYGRS